MVSLPIGVGFNARLSCQRGEGALLNLESGQATYNYCEQTVKLHLGNYLKQNYREILGRIKYAGVLEPHDLFHELVPIIMVEELVNLVRLAFTAVAHDAPALRRLSESQKRSH